MIVALLVVGDHATLVKEVITWTTKGSMSAVLAVLEDFKTLGDTLEIVVQHVKAARYQGPRLPLAAHARQGKKPTRPLRPPLAVTVPQGRSHQPNQQLAAPVQLILMQTQRRGRPLV